MKLIGKLRIYSDFSLIFRPLKYIIINGVDFFDFIPNCNLGGIHERINDNVSSGEEGDSFPC